MTTIVVEEGKFISRRRKHDNLKDQKKQTLVTNVDKQAVNRIRIEFIG